MYTCKFSNTEPLLLQIKDEDWNILAKCYYNGEIYYNLENSRKRELESDIIRTALLKIRFILHDLYSRSMSYDEFLKLSDTLEIHLLNELQKSTYTGFGFQFERIKFSDIRLDPKDRKLLEEHYKSKIQKLSWTCDCGSINTSNFCPVCGKKRIVKWICSCGKENTNNFCSECGKKRSS